MAHLRWAGWVLAGAAALSGTLTAAEQPPGVRVVRGSLAPPPSAERSPGPAQPSGDLEAAQEAPVHAPLPVPEMPPPPREAAAPAIADRPAAPLFDAPFDAPPMSRSFAALGDSNTSIPPDTHGAVGPNHLMVVLNTQFLVQNRTGGTVFGPKPLNLSGAPANAFWATVNLNGTGAFDPRVVYDPFADRWVVVSCDEAASANSRLLVGVSKTGVPDLAATSWHQAAIDVDPGTTLWADYPSVGFSAQWVVVQVNLFRVSDNGFARSHIYVFNKTQMYLGNLSAFVLLDLDGATFGGTQVPAVTYDTGVDDAYLLQRWNSTTGDLRLYRITGPVGSPTLVPVGFPSGDPWTDNPGDVDFAPQLQGPPGCVYCVPGPCPPRKVRTGDSRIQNVVLRNGKLWAAHTVVLSLPSRTSVQWWQIGTDASVTQRGLVDDPFGIRFFAFPSIAVNKNDDVLLGYSRFQGDEYAGASYSYRTALDLPGAMQSESRLKDGLSCYYKHFTSNKNRWGDYSATVVDPDDDKKMWTIQEYAAASLGSGEIDDRWGTWWGMLDPTPVISVTDTFVIEGDSGTTPATFDLTLSIATSQAVSVGWTTANGSATTGDGDFVGASGTVVFAPGETAKTITVAVNGDTKEEPLESFFVNLTLQSPGNATLPDGQAEGSIGNDDPIPQVSIGDRQVVEGSPSGTTLAVFLVTLSNPSSTTVSVNYGAAPGSATIGSVSPDDLNPAGGTLVFNPGVVELPVTVNVLRDLDVEPDETFFVNLSSPSNATILKGTGNGLIRNDDPASSEPGVSFLTAVSDGGVSTGRNRLQWLNPPAGGAPTGIRIKWNQGASCGAPDPFDPNVVSFGTVAPDEVYLGPGVVQGYEHGGRPVGLEHCYTVWVQYGASWSLPGATVLATPFNSSTGRIRWKYFTGLGATTVAPPTVGADGVLVPSNDNLVHGLTRGTGPNGGTWPTAWKPANLGSQAQARSPIVPLVGGSRAFYSTFDGWVHAVDARTGAILWETKIGTGPQTGAGGAPAGIFTAFGGPWDYILVGTRQASNNRFYALDPMNGAVIDSFPGGVGDPVGEMGAVTGMAAVDYANGQACFGTFLGAANSLWCLRLGPPSDALQFAGWAVPQATIGDVDGSPVIRNGRVYVGTTAGLLWSVNATNALDLYSHTPSGGSEPIKGFPFPDRGSNALYFSTTTRVHAAVDNGPGNFVQKWAPTTGLTSPSPVLYWAAQNRVYVGLKSYGGGPGAWIYDIDAATGSATPIQLELGLAITVGAPSLDTGVAPVMMHAGSEAGVIYAVQVP